jgi:hypothetical protein
LKVWNKTTFGNVFGNVSVAINEVNRIQGIIDSGSITDEVLAQDYQAQLILSQALMLLDQFWREKARAEHFLHGDRNTSYFHRVARIHSSTKHISLIKNGEEVLEDPLDIERHILDYFISIFGSPNNCGANNIIDSCIPAFVSHTDNDMVCNLPSAAEIKRTVFDMNVDGAPGPDGFGGHFYQYFWDVIVSGVVAAVQEIFIHGTLLHNLNSNLIVIIPKVTGADNMGYFRPIALANFQFKIITKLLADRLSIIAPKIIYEHQSRFITGRQIFDCVIVVSEAVNVLNRQGFAGN